MAYYYRYNKFSQDWNKEKQVSGGKNNKGNNDSNLQQNHELDNLIVEDNTVYEIDYECVERLKKNRRSERGNRE